MKSLRFVVTATVLGAPGSRVLLTPGSLAPSRTDVTGRHAPHHFHPPCAAARPHDLLTVDSRYHDASLNATSDSRTHTNGHLMMKPAIDEQLLRFVDNFWGYGSLSASYWFIGMEEGGGDSWRVVLDQLEAWEGGGAPQMARFRPPQTQLNSNRWFGPDARIQPYWGKIIRVRLAAEGRKCDRDSVRDYQVNQLAAPHGDTCLLELLPLPSPSTKDWIYGRHSSLSLLKNRPAYLAELVPRRVHALRSLISEHRPPYVIFVGLSYAKLWNSVAGTDLPTRPERPVTCPGSPTRMVISRHPSSRGVTNEYFEQIGRALTNNAV